MTSCTVGAPSPEDSSSAKSTASKELTPDVKRLIRIYSRNLQFETFVRDWSIDKVAEMLGTTPNAISRIRREASVYIDVDILTRCLEVFNCTPNDMLLERDYLNYDD